MARARNIKPALFKNELLGVADPLLTLLFQSLWTLADKEGRLEDRPLRIKAETFPYRDSIDVNGYLTELQRLGFIVRYSVDGLALILVVNFKKHQTPHNTEKPSVLPLLEAGTIAGDALQAASVKSPLSNGENVNALPPDSLLLITDSLKLIPDKNTVKNKNTALIAPDDIFPEIQNRQIITDWLAIRKAKSAPVTKIALEGIEREARKAKMSLDDALRMCCENNWSGFRASWSNSDRSGGAKKPNKFIEALYTGRDDRNGTTIEHES